jgi:hypothetical protein
MEARTANRPPRIGPQRLRSVGFVSVVMAVLVVVVVAGLPEQG